MGLIIHGNKNFGFAPITTSNDVTSFGTPVLIPGLVGMTIEVEQEDTNIYADDSVFCVAKGAKVRTATATVRNIPAAYLPYLGYLAQANGGFTDTGVFPAHCIFFETGGENCETGTTTRRLHFLYMNLSNKVGQKTHAHSIHRIRESSLHKRAAEAAATNG